MTTSEWLKLCPYGKGSDMRTVFSVLARAKKPLPMQEIVAKAKIKADTTRNMLSAMRSKYHGNSLKRAGVQVAKADEGYLLDVCEPDAEAKRPALKKKAGKKKKK